MCTIDESFVSLIFYFFLHSQRVSSLVHSQLVFVRVSKNFIRRSLSIGVSLDNDGSSEHRTDPFRSIGSSSSSSDSKSDVAPDQSLKKKKQKHVINK